MALGDLGDTGHLFHGVNRTALRRDGQGDGCGLGAVLLRNVLERRRELALLRATGFQPLHLTWLVLAENVLLLGCGLLTGVSCALVAIAPAFVARGGHVSVVSLGLLLLAVLATGLAASWLAVRAVLRAPLLAALRSE